MQLVECLRKKCYIILSPRRSSESLEILFLSGLESSTFWLPANRLWTMLINSPSSPKTHLYLWLSETWLLLYMKTVSMGSIQFWTLGDQCWCWMQWPITNELLRQGPAQSPLLQEPCPDLTTPPPHPKITPFFDHVALCCSSPVALQRAMECTLSSCLESTLPEEKQCSLTLIP